MGVAVGGQAGAPLLYHLDIPTSDATLLRLVRQWPLPVTQPPRVVGVDDRGPRQGQSYGTIVVDLQQCHIVDLLPSPTSAMPRPAELVALADSSLAEWRRHEVDGLAE